MDFPPVESTWFEPPHVTARLADGTFVVLRLSHEEPEGVYQHHQVAGPYLNEHTMIAAIRAFWENGKFIPASSDLELVDDDSDPTGPAPD
jgi:hypothetical protein